jgi:hypothetical protein
MSYTVRSRPSYIVQKRTQPDEPQINGMTIFMNPFSYPKRLSLNCQRMLYNLLRAACLTQCAQRLLAGQQLAPHEALPERLYLALQCPDNIAVVEVHHLSSTPGTPKIVLSRLFKR